MVEDIDKEMQLFENNGIEFTFTTPENFFKVVEILKRTGVLDFKNKRLFQTGNILHKRKRYIFVHFKEMFIIDGKNANISDNDYIRRDYIFNLLVKWGLVTPTGRKNDIVYPDAKSLGVRVLKKDELKDWTLVPKYTFKAIKNNKFKEKVNDDQY